MEFLIFYAIGQSFLLLFLFAKDKNDGEKEFFREQKWSASDIVLLVLSINVLELLLYYLLETPFIYRSLYQLILRKNPHIFHSFILLLLTCAFLITLLRFRIKQNIKILGFKKNNLLKNIGLGMTTAFIFSLISVIIDLTTGPDSSAIEIVREIKNLSGLSDYILYFLVIVILGPIVEESIYRGMLYSPYRKKYGPTKAIIITSLFFSVIHLKVGFGCVFIYGLVYGALYERTESIVPPIVAHGLSNLIGTLSVLYFTL